MQTRLKLNQKILFQGKNYKVIGIDTYILKNLLDKTKTWVSYTLIDDKNNKIWISYGTSGKYFTQWAIISQKAYKLYAKNLKLDLTGIAEISFQGNPGYSTPASEIVWFDASSKDFDYVSLERFLEQKKNKVTPLEPYYQSGKILRDFKI